MKKINFLVVIRNMVVNSKQTSETPVVTSFVNQIQYQKSFEEGCRATDEKLKTLVNLGKRKI